MPADSTRWIQLLEESGLRITPVRLGVLNVLGRNKQPADVPSIMAKLPGHADAVTVYRTLNTFLRTKLVHRVRGEDRSWRYAVGEGHHPIEHHHPHFVCDDCGKVECLVEAEVPKGLVKKLGVARDHVINHSEVVLHGICPNCQ